MISAHVEQGLPLVSVVMPTFNSAAHLRNSIASVQSQTFAQWELWVVDGGSSDSTRAIVAEISAADPRVQLVINHNDQGPGHARSTGVRRSRGKYVAFLDADDMWLTAKLEKQVAYMEARGARFTYTRYRRLSADGRATSCLVPMRDRFDFATVLRRRGIGALTVMVDRSVLTEDVITVSRKAGGEDSLWWFLVLRNGVVAELVDEDLARYRDTPGSLSKNQLLTLRTVWSMYRVELALPLYRAAWDYLSYFIDSAIRRGRLKLCALIGEPNIQERTSA